MSIPCASKTLRLIKDFKGIVDALNSNFKELAKLKAELSLHDTEVPSEEFLGQIGPNNSWIGSDKHHTSQELARDREWYLENS